MNSQTLTRGVVQQGLIHAQRKQIQLYTVAFYLDHESRALSLCFDTYSNSNQHVSKSNKFSAKYFQAAIDAGDMEEALLWQANVGRSLSLGDFAHVNVARTPLHQINLDERLILNMVEALNQYGRQFGALAPCSSKLIFLCSDLSDEVGLTWSLHDP